MTAAIKSLKKKKNELRVELQNIEKQIFDLETTYLEETKEFGNIFTGWNAYLSTNKVKPKKHISVEERLFSLSSVTSPASRKEIQKNKVRIKQGADGPVKRRKNKESVDSNINESTLEFSNFGAADYEKQQSIESTEELEQPEPSS